MAGVFISYRREDSSAYAGRLYDHLAQRFGKDCVFMDVDSIEPGADFIEVLQNTVSSCDVLIAVIGKHWLMATDTDGRRLDHSEDLVRVEIVTALNRNVRVIPALVAGAQMPASHELPGALESLARRNAFELPDASFVSSLNRLIESIEKALPVHLTAPVLPQSSAGVSKRAASLPIDSPLTKIPKWRRWLLLYRPYSFGGIVCRLLCLWVLGLDLKAMVVTFPQGAYKEFGSWVVLGLLVFVVFCFSAVAQRLDRRAIDRRALPS